MPRNMLDSDMKQERRDERGAALISMLLISMLLLSAGGALILTTAMSATNSVDSSAETQAYYAAQAGLQGTLNVLRGNVLPNPLLDPSSSTSPGNHITFRRAVTASTSNSTGDTNGPRLSRWLTYNSTYNRVVITEPYSPINGLAYSTSITDPDNSSRVIFSTQGAFGNGAASSTVTKNYGGGNSKVTVKFDGQASTTINDSGNSTLGTFTISNIGTGNYTIPANETFTITVAQTAPWAATTTITCTLSGTISSGGGNLIITFPAPTTNNLQGTLLARSATQFNLPSGATSVAVAVTAPDPTRLLVKVVGYGPRAARKQMQMLLNKYAFDYTAASTITLRSADDNSTLTFNAGSSSAYDYSGFDNAGAANLPSFAVTSSADYNYLNTLSLPSGQVVGNPAGLQQVSVSSLPTFLQTADAARALVSQLRIQAQGINRYYTTDIQPPNFGTTSQPVMTFVDGDTDLPPGGGAGLLVVTGTLTLRGSSEFHGLILVLGGGQLLRDG
ncbi:MAG TPA: hypothetical protein VEV81_03225, partial [Pyrinomonadaceae bacterium]|nr:hypothetical protein [Pyrinomonadaceae bacterium]